MKTSPKLHIVALACALLPFTAQARTSVFGPAYDPDGNPIPDKVNVYEIIGIGDQGGSYTVAKPWYDSYLDAITLTDPIGGSAETGNLAASTSAELNAWLAHYSGRTNAWIGLTDDDTIFGGTEAGTDKNGGWVWTNGDPFLYQNWFATEPNDSGGEDATHLRGDSLWNDQKTNIPGTGQDITTANYRAIVQYRTEISINALEAFKVTTYKARPDVFDGGTMDNLADARNMINAAGEYSTRTSSSQNFSVASIGGSDVWFGPMANYSGSGGDHFVVQGTGQLDVGVADGGIYTFGIAGDDGGSFYIDLNQDNDFDDAGENVIVDDAAHGNTAYFGTATLTGGQSYDFEWVGFEKTGGDGWDAVYSKGDKIASAEVVQGTFPTGVSAVNGWALVGDGTQGITTTDALGGGGAAGVTLTEYYRTGVLGKDVVDLTAALDVIANAADRDPNFGPAGDGVFSAYLPTFNIQDSGGAQNFGSGQSDEDTLPGFPQSDQDDHVVVGEAYIDFPAAGDYTLGSAADDGQRISIDLDNSGTFDAPAEVMESGCCGNQFFNITVPAPGLYQVEYLYWENGGGAGGELFAASGTTTTIADFQLVGDVANGGLRVKATPDADAFNPFQITFIDVDPTTKDVTLRWPSTPGKTYKIWWSADMRSPWENDVVDNYPTGGATDTTTEHTFPNPDGNAPAMFFIVEEESPAN